MKRNETTTAGASPAGLIDARIAELDDWRGETLARIRALIKEDPKGLFNSSLEGNVRRAIDLHEGDALDADAFEALVRGAAP